LLEKRSAAKFFYGSSPDSRGRKRFAIKPGRALV
jgi:hypothetical protein